MEQLERLHSGIEGLDALLKGGLVAGASYIVQGRPGSGKTILANQIGFNHVRNGGRVLVATLLAETHERLFQFLSTLSFFDASKVGDEIQFVSAFDTLENEGLDEVVRLLRREISRQKATVMIVDGVLNARSKADTPMDTKKFISELQGHAAFAGCTVLFLTSARLDDGSPEHTMVDGVIELGEELVGNRSVRRIHLRKTRGSGSLSGLHECEITENSLVVYPRLESLYSRPTLPEDATPRRIASGTPDLDALIEGGLPVGSVTLAMGPAGVGKTCLGLGFLGQASAGEPAMHFGFYESPARLRLKARALGFDLEALEKAGVLHLAWQPPHRRPARRPGRPPDRRGAAPGHQAPVHRQLRRHGPGGQQPGAAGGVLRRPAGPAAGDGRDHRRHLGDARPLQRRHQRPGTGAVEHRGQPAADAVRGSEC